MDESTMETFIATALAMLKERLDRVSGYTERDEYYTMRIKQAIGILTRKGVALTNSADDLMLVVDLAAWQHANRDKPGGQPEWLRRQINGRWVNNDP